MHDGVEILHVIAELCAQCTVEPVGQILYRDFVGQRLVIARADRIDLPGPIPARQLLTPGPERRPLIRVTVDQNDRPVHVSLLEGTSFKQLKLQD
jgi:hypothetical protein